MNTLTKIYLGLMIIERIQPDAGVAVDHDQIFCGTAEDTPEDERARLESLGWFDSDGYWSLHV